MRFVSVVVGGLLVALAVARADAAVPNSITALLGPSIGYLLGQSDLCGWNLNDRIHTTYRNAFQQLGMTEAQKTAVWSDAKARETRLSALPQQAKAGMKANICTSSSRAQLEQDLAE
jgi:hypothetical protein